MDEDCQPTQQESLMKEQVGKTESVCREEPLLQSTAILEQMLEQKKERLIELPSMGVCVCVRGGLRVFSVDFWYSEGWTLRNEALLASENYQTSVVDSV